ncbi:MAG: fructose-bisphosphatase class II family protein, partial [Anaerolineae bacterium]|nr:fructose-bisphosphatase class II family protein [Anaerolineae bacterium]
GPAVYMEKIVVNRDVASFLVPECLDAPAAWTLALIARAKQKELRDLVVFVLDRPRHKDLIDEIRTAGARVLLRPDGDVSGALLAAAPRGKVDVLMGTGGAMEGVVAACAIRALGGAMLASLLPQSEGEQASITSAGIDLSQILNCTELVRSDEIFFAATGISDGTLLSGVQYHGSEASTESLVLRSKTGTRRTIFAEHTLALYKHILGN